MLEPSFETLSSEIFYSIRFDSFSLWEWEESPTFEAQQFERMLSAYESTPFPRADRRDHRRRRNQTAPPALGLVVGGGDCNRHLRCVPRPFNLYLGALVRLAWLLGSLLVHVQAKGRLVRDLLCADSADSARRVLDR